MKNLKIKKCELVIDRNIYFKIKKHYSDAIPENEPTMMIDEEGNVVLYINALDVKNILKF